ncbi:integrase core domain-containing protein [Nonomuraea sp. NPDC005650]|uniref:integrase core domain-containing protein n=1 Tax=Nonomuraea sp. NPDC005650 TaxID=3157045 RepID=UPI0033B0998E
MLILNEDHLRRTLIRYLEHYNTARPHRSIGQLSPSQAETGPPTSIDLADQRVHRRAIPGGLNQRDRDTRVRRLPAQTTGIGPCS